MVFFSFATYDIYGEEEETKSILQQIEILQKDIKTLEKAVYSQPSTGTSSSGELSNSGDVLTQHLLKLSDLEEQFKILTNSFEEINFKLDKLSSRITKVQTDNQMRFQDLEKSGLTQDENIVSVQWPACPEQQCSTVSRQACRLPSRSGPML